MKNSLILIFFAAFLSLGLTSCGDGAGSHGGKAVADAISKDIDAATFKQMLADGKFIAIDIRKPKERFSDNIFKDLNKPYGYIPGTQLNIDWENKTFMDEMEKLDKSKAYGIYCRSGNRSGKALRAMKGMGFKEVYNLDHGMKGWMKAGFETEVVPKPE